MARTHRQKLLIAAIATTALSTSVIAIWIVMRGSPSSGSPLPHLSSATGARTIKANSRSDEKSPAVSRTNIDPAQRSLAVLDQIRLSSDTPARLLRTYFTTAHNLYTTKGPDAAHPYFKRLADEGPVSVERLDAIRMVDQTARDAGRYEEAIEYATRGLELAKELGTDGEVLAEILSASRAFSLSRQGDHARAIADRERVLSDSSRISVDGFRERTMLAQVTDLEKTGRTLEALAMMDAVLASSAGLEGDIRVMAHFQRSKLAGERPGSAAHIAGLARAWSDPLALGGVEILQVGADLVGWQTKSSDRVNDAAKIVREMESRAEPVLRSGREDERAVVREHLAQSYIYMGTAAMRSENLIEARDWFNRAADRYPKTQSGRKAVALLHELDDRERLSQQRQ